MSSMSSSQIVSATAMQNRGMFSTPGITGNPIPMHAMLTSPGTQCNNINYTMFGKLVKYCTAPFFKDLY